MNTGKTLFAQIQAARRIDQPGLLKLPLLQRMARRLPLRDGQRNGPDARHLPAQAIALDGGRRHQREHLYEHDVGISRLRRVMQSMAAQEIAALAPARQAA